MSHHPSGPNHLGSLSRAEALNARFAAYSSHASTSSYLASPSPSPSLQHAYVESPTFLDPTPPLPPVRRLPPLPVSDQHPFLSHAPSSYHFPTTSPPPPQPPEPSFSTSLPPPEPQGHRQTSWEDEERERDIALAKSVEEMRLNEQDRREREQIRRAEEESLKDHLRERQTAGSWETWEVGKGNGTYDGLGGGGQSSYQHTPPLSDHKTPPPQISSSRPSPSTFFSDEFRIHSQTIEKLKQWQAGEIPISLEWWEVVPNEMRDSLEKKEVERQGLIWEIFRSEQAYVSNLQAGLNGFFTPLATADPSVMPSNKIQPFLDEVFHNINSIFPKHSRMVFRLQERQLESHPVIHSISDILIDSLFDLLVDYERYLKHYPYAEARLRREMTKNEAFRDFINTCSRDPITHKQDLGSFLVSPLGRLSKLGLVLRRLQQITPPEHEDREQIPVVLDQIDTMLRSVQPGVDAATAKVKAWQIGQKLLFRRGERIDLMLDLGADERALLFQGRICRRNRTERDWHGWTDLYLFLFDNYLVITREETRPGGDPKEEEDRRYAVVSRPIPLEFLQLVGKEDDAGEHRRDMMIDYQRTKPVKVSTILEPLTQPDRTIYPFHIEHKASGKGYSLYVETPTIRKEWISKILDQLTVKRVSNENNQIFSFQTLAYTSPRRTSSSRPGSTKRLSEGGNNPDSLFQMSSLASASSLNLHRASTSDLPSPISSMPPLSPPLPSPSVGSSSSRIVCGAVFNRDGREFLVVGDSSGVTIGFRDDPQSHRQIIESSSIMDLHVLEPFDRLLVLATNALYSYPLGDLLPGPEPSSWVKVRKESGETLNGWGESVSLLRVGYREGVLLVVYASYNRLIAQTTLHVLEPFSVEPPRQQSRSLNGPLNRPAPVKSSYRPFAQAFVPGSVLNINFFDKNLFLPTDRGFVILDVLNLSKNLTVPVFPDNYASNAILSSLKSRICSSKGLFFVMINANAFLLVYEAGCLWIDASGKILNSGAYVSWETRPSHAALRGRHLILFEREGRSLEIRDVLNGGRLVEVLDAPRGERLRLVGDDTSRPVMGTMRGIHGERETLFQLVETEVLPVTPMLRREGGGSWQG